MSHGELLTVRTNGSGQQRLTIQVDGEIDIATAPKLRSCIEAALETGMDVIVDTENVVFMDAAGVRVLENALTLAAGLDRHFGLHPAGRIVTRLLVITRTLYLLLPDAKAPRPTLAGTSPVLTTTSRCHCHEADVFLGPDLRPGTLAPRGTR
jgi:anti-sigma B factor antagonist